MSSHRRDTRTGARWDPAGAEFSGSRSGKRESCHIIRRTLDGCFLRRPGHAVGVRHAAVHCSARRRRISAAQIPQFAAAQAGAAWLVGQQAADGSVGGLPLEPLATVNGILALAALTWTPAAAWSALTLVEANADAYITVDGADGPCATGRADPRRACHECRPDQLRGNEPRVTSPRHRADLGTRHRDCSGRSQQLNDFLVGTYVQGLVFTALQGGRPDGRRSRDQLAHRSAVRQRWLDLAGSGHLGRRAAPKIPRTSRGRTTKRRRSPSRDWPRRAR